MNKYYTVQAKEKKGKEWHNLSDFNRESEAKKCLNMILVKSMNAGYAFRVKTTYDIERTFKVF